LSLRRSKWKETHDEHSALIEARNLKVFYRRGSIFSRPRWVPPDLFSCPSSEFVASQAQRQRKNVSGKALLNLIPTWQGTFTGRA
jgi:hypothetical protein